MEATIAFLAYVVGLILAIAHFARQGAILDSLTQIVRSDNEHVTAHAALTEVRESKSAVEAKLLTWADEDPAIKNLSRDDVRSVMKLLGKHYRSLHKDELVAQARDMQSW